MPKSASARGRFDVAALRTAIAQLSGRPTISRPALAQLIDAHPNSIALWESGKPIGPRFLDKLRELEAKVARGEKLALPQTKKRGRPRKAGRAPKAARSAKASGRGPARGQKATGSFHVKALRSRIGASRVVLAKLLGVSAGSILNWESGKPITEKNVALLREVEKNAASGALEIPARRGPGRPRKGATRVAPAARRGRPRGKVAISGQSVPLYANVIQVERGRRDALIRLALEDLGGGARLVADVYVPLEALDGLL